jgi:hypothetical protein
LARTGITPGNLWITRLRSALPASALSADLVLEASSSQTNVPNVHNASAYTIPNYNPCPASSGASPGPSSSGSCACVTAASSRTPPSDTIAFALAFLGLAVAAGRKRSR